MGKHLVADKGKYEAFRLSVRVAPVVAWTMRLGETEALPVIGQTNEYGSEHSFYEYPNDVQDEPGNIRDYRVVPAAAGSFMVLVGVWGREAGDCWWAHVVGENMDNATRADRNDGCGDGWILGGNQYVVVQAATAAEALKTQQVQRLLAGVEEILRGRYPKATVTMEEETEKAERDEQ